MSNLQLLQNVKIGDIELQNHMAMAPLTRNRAINGNTPGPLTLQYYVQRSSAGLIITEGSQITAAGQGYPRTPGIHSDAQIKAWSEVTAAVHAKGGRIFLQLWHVGRISHPSMQPDGQLPVAPSAVKPAGQVFTFTGLQDYVTPRALETAELPGIVEQYRQAAQNAKQAGFDGVEIHAANGYLLDQFLRDGTNLRTDNYGGSVENRARLLLEVTQAVVDVWGAGRVGVRLSPNNPFNDMCDSNAQATFAHVIQALNPFKLAYLHMVEGGIGPQADLAPVDYPALRALWQGAYMANGGYTVARAEQAIASGYAQVVSFGVPFIANPDLPERFRVGADLNPVDPSTFYMGEEKGYVDYPALQTALA